MHRQQKNGIHWLEFALLANYPIKQGTFLRHGGCSPFPYTSLNLGDNVQDQAEHIHQNRKLIKDILNINTIATLRQCHGDAIVEINDDYVPSQPFVGDALISKSKNIALGIMHADCQAALFYDPRSHVMANVHAGWRGNVQNIYSKVIKKMQDQYQTEVKDLIVCISPSLGPKSAEFINYRCELPEAFWSFQIKPNFFDLWEISRRQLLECGVRKHNIEIAEMDTFQLKEDFFSYRRDKITGRNGTFIALL